ncbi:MAG: PQQ-binding-like beta-propeller repeat protein [Proteobacteria bacterium]|nr:PQQ-binding-like beta-propeller repeat protein [Pseudomonadota bacterium]
MKPNIRLAILLICFILFSGCGKSSNYDYRMPLAPDSPWPKFRLNAEQNGRSPIQPNKKDGLFWSFPTGKGVFNSPVISGDGTIYIGSADRIFYALNLDGTVRWQFLTGEIIDSAALLDNKGRVYFGSGDGCLRALNAQTGDLIWQFLADEPSVNNAFIRWFEGNVAMSPNGDLIVPNDNYFLYSINRDTGQVNWRFKSPDQNWSLPALDTITGNLFFGNDNVVKLFGDNSFSVDKNGNKLWSNFSKGAIAASPLLTARGTILLGGFDGFLHAYNSFNGQEIWKFGARDHIYASPAELSDGTIIQPAADGTIYALDPESGSQLWAFDTREAVRSSPAVDGQDHIYVGSGEGRLFVLNPEGTLRWAIQLIAEERNDLNSSPALGKNAIYTAGENGEVFSIPYDYCLRKEMQDDSRCLLGPGEDLPTEGTHLFYTTQFGGLLTNPPETINANAALAFSLFVRQNGDTALALIDSNSVQISSDPPSPITVQVSGERRFLTVEPLDFFPAGTSGKMSLTISGSYLVNPERDGLRFSGGDQAGNFLETFTFSLNQSGPQTLPLPVPQNPGDDSGVWELNRLAASLPTILASYNQIGFDGLHFLVGLVEGQSGGKGIAWMVGAKLAEGENKTVIDPETGAMLPLEFNYNSGLFTLSSERGMKLKVMNETLSFRTFRISARLDSSGAMADTPQVHASLVCADLGFFAPYIRELGFCNPDTDILNAFGAFNLTPYAGGTQSAPAGLGNVTFTAGNNLARAAFSGSSLKASEHSFGILMIDPATNRPVALDYGLETRKNADDNGTIESVELTYENNDVPAQARVYLMVDAYPAVKTLLTLK